MSRRVLMVAGAVLAGCGSSGAQSYGFATYTAAVQASGTLASSSGVASATNSGAGKYVVTFNRPVSTCVSVAGISGASSSYVTSSNSANDTTSLIVRTYAPGGAQSNFAFNLIVSCGP